MKFSMSIKLDQILNPLTALEFYQSSAFSETLILAGEGCWLKVFKSKSSALLCQFRVFKDQVIHGIAVRQYGETDNAANLDVAIWGGSCLAAFTRQDFLQLLTSDNKWPGVSGDADISYSKNNASDWILDALISKNDELFLVTAHNTVFRGRLQKDILELKILNSPSRSILYSAHLVFESERSVIVAAGTVFGEIILWRCLLDGSSWTSRVIRTFSGHEGSIFGVNISEVVVAPNGTPTRLLASCSDDRTIRIWETDLAGHAEQISVKTVRGRETGFGKNVQKAPSDNALAIIMGHSSRIWSVQFLLTNSSICILSFGEDATTQYWELKDSGYSALSANTSPISNRDNRASMIHRETFSFNSGKHIWSKAMRSDDDFLVTVITGGADGKIPQWKIAPINHSQLQSWDPQEIFQNLPPMQVTEPYLPTEQDKLTPIAKKPIKDAFNKYAFVSENQVLATTTFGRVLIGEIRTSIRWSEVVMPAGNNDLRSYSIVKSIPEKGIAFLGSANGTVFLYLSGSIRLFGSVQGKIADMFAVRATTIELVATTLISRIATLFKVRGFVTGYDRVLTPLLQFQSKEEGLGMQSHQLQLRDKFIVTSAGKISDHLILGSRFGSLAIYDSEKSQEALCTWSPISPGDAVTSIVSLPHLSEPGYFVTTARNGTYAIFYLKDSLSIVHEGTPPFGPMVEAAWFLGSDLIMHGFKSKNFIVWNETKQCEIASVECGGAHRSYAYSTVGGSGGAGYFVYTKASRMYLHSRNQPSHQIIKRGGHGREIKACAVSPDGLIATGAEDTTIRIWTFQEGGSSLNKSLNCLAVLQKHTTGIQHLQWYGSSYLFSSGGNEEFFVWAVNPIPGFGTGLVCESSCPDQSEDKDLRIMSFDVSLLSTSEDGSEKLLISLAYSDSMIKCYTYSRATGFSLIGKGQYGSSCLMQLHHLKVGDEPSCLTAGTDGFLTFWRLALDTLSDDPSGARESHMSDGARRIPKLSVLSNHRLHQSSIKTLDITTKGNLIIVATGGDDNALGVTVYNVTNLQRQPRSMIIVSAHAAAITGLSIVPQPAACASGEMRIITSSNDQRVKEWEVCIREESDDCTGKPDEGVHLRKVGDVFTSVADVGDVAAIPTEAGSRKVLVVGNGIEIYDLSSIGKHTD